MLERSLLAGLSRCAWKVVSRYLKQAVPYEDENIMGLRHSGFNIFCGPTIWPREEKGLENLARYIIRASVSQERMTYVPAHDSPDGTAKVICESKDGKTSKTFDAPVSSTGQALDWLAQLVTHIPNRGEQMVRIEFIYDDDYSHLPPVDYWLQ